MKIDLECDLNSLFSRALDVDLEAKTRKMLRERCEVCGRQVMTKQKSFNIHVDISMLICGVEQSKKITPLRTFVCPRAVNSFTPTFAWNRFSIWKFPTEINRQCKMIFFRFCAPNKKCLSWSEAIFHWRDPIVIRVWFFSVRLNIGFLLRIRHRVLSNGRRVWRLKSPIKIYWGFKDFSPLHNNHS